MPQTLFDKNLSNAANQHSIFKKRNEVVLTHDLSLLNLSRMLSLGGSISPSIAASKPFESGTGFLAGQAFGSIRLIIKPSAVHESLTASVYDRDAYTMRCPPVVVTIDATELLDALTAYCNDDVSRSLLDKLDIDNLLSSNEELPGVYNLNGLTADLLASNISRCICNEQVFGLGLPEERVEIYLENNRHLRYDDRSENFMGNLVDGVSKSKGMVLDGDFLPVGYGIGFDDLIDAAMEGHDDSIGAELQSQPDNNQFIINNIMRIASATSYTTIIDMLEDVKYRLSGRLTSPNCEITYAARSGIGVLSKGSSVVRRLMDAASMDEYAVARELVSLVKLSRMDDKANALSRMESLGVEDASSLLADICVCANYYQCSPIPYAEIKLNSILTMDSVHSIICPENLKDDVSDALKSHGVDMDVLSYAPDDSVARIALSVSGDARDFSIRGLWDDCDDLRVEPSAPSSPKFN